MSPPGSLAPRAAAAALAALALCCAFAAVAAADADATDPPQTTDASAPTTTAPVIPSPEVEVTQGRMRGTVMKTRKGRPIFAYRGIPYAQPPVGELRFQAPVPALPWMRVLDAIKDGSPCVQKNYLVPPYPLSGDEDCLFLNVYSPKVDRTARLPVIVYIHGGGFFAGSGASYLNGPQYLLEHDVLLVTINYRLGALGFLSSGDDRVPGNAGLKDQVLALHWVRENIEAFGGDPNLVTIMGQSAGGASVHYHMLSPLSRGLFQRAISQSGWALATWARPRDPVPIALKQAEFVGCNAVSMDDALACLRQVDAYNLTESGHLFHFWDIDPLTVFRPVIEAPRRHSFLADDPAVIMQMGDFAHVPWLTGVVTGEGIIRALPILSDKSLPAQLNERWDEIMPKLMELEDSVDPIAVPAIWQNISDFYVGDSKPHVDISRPQPFINLYSDRGFLQGFKKAVQLHVRAGHKRIFLYEMAYRGNFSYSMLFGGKSKNYGVSHCDDLLYLLYAYAIFSEMPVKGSADDAATSTFTQLWTNFAKYGDPTPSIPNSKKRTPQRTPPLATASRGKGRSEDNQTGEPYRCWVGAAEARWLPHEPTARSNDCELRFMRIESPQQAPGAQAEGAQAEGAPQPRLCMRKGFHQRRLDYWSSLPLKENKASGLVCRS